MAAGIGTHAAEGRKFWGWGTTADEPSDAEKQAVLERLGQRFDLSGLSPAAPPRIEEIALPPPRIEAPRTLEAFVTTDAYERAGHTYGKAFKDIVKGFQRDFGPAPDLVAYPRNESDLVDLLDWCASANLAAIPYGGGSSVVGGVEADVGPGYAGAVSIDLAHLAGVVELDLQSRAANIRAGTYGPALEAALRPHGLTLRHFPQSFQYSTLGGWIATRSGGHYATLYTHIDDFVENLRVITPTGVVESRRLPGSGAGPSPDRLFIGSEGALGIITSAWMRLQARPVHRANASVTFPDFARAAEGVRRICQAALFPANVRILDETEALINGVAGGDVAVMVLGFESADHPVDAWLARALEIARDAGGHVPEAAGGSSTDPSVTRQGMAGKWRESFIKMPYFRDTLVGMGIISETFETAITWERFGALHARVMTELRRAVTEVCGNGSVSCRFTHAYPDGPAPYYTVTGVGKVGSQLEMMAEIKAAASEAILGAGGTITHHHAVGRYHDPWYRRQIPEGFTRALIGAKRALDPAAILNPGVIVPALK